MGAHPVAVIGYGLWRRLGGNPPVVGRTIYVDNRPLTVVDCRSFAELG